MNESNHQMDKELNLFEQELRSLTPRSGVSMSDPSLTNDARMSHMLGRDWLEGGPPLASQQSTCTSVIPSVTKSNWWTTVAVSWSSGLAAGLLLSAIWTQWNMGGFDISGEITSGERFASTNDLPPSSLDSNLPPPNKGDASNSRSNPWPDSQRTRLGNTFRGGRYVAIQGNQQDVLRPFLQLYDINNDWRFTSRPTHKTFFDIPSWENAEIRDEPNVAPSELKPVPPAQQSVPQNQRQLLQSLYQSEFRI